MSQITITEALSEVTLIKKKIASTYSEIGALNRPVLSHVPDPYEKSGGTAKKIESHLQSIRDLKARLFRIKTAIQKANLETEVAFGSHKMSIAEALIWKELFISDHIAQMENNVNLSRRQREEKSNRPEVYKTEAGETKFAVYTFPLDIEAIGDEVQKEKDALQKLDGQLSLKNATTLIELG